MRAKISKRTIDALPVGKSISDAEVRGFRARRLPSGTVLYEIRYTTESGTRPYLRLGEHGNITAEQARGLAKQAAGKVAAGRDPVAEKAGSAAAAKKTVKAVLDEYLKLACGMKHDADGYATFSGKLRSAPQKLDCFERLVYPRLGRVPITKLPRSKIVEMLDEIEAENGPVMADRTLAHLRKALNWHASRTDDFHSPVVRGMARTKPKERAGKRVLADDEIRDIFAVLAAGGKGIPEAFARLQRLLFYAAVRRDEAADMARKEVAEISRDKFQGLVWTVPGNRMKGKLDHAVPVTDAILAQIEPDASGPYIFSTTGGKRPFSGFSKAKHALDREIAALRKREGRPPIAPWKMQQDVRRTARTLMSRAGVPSEIGERVIAHAIPGVEGIYDKWEYLPEKLDALNKLAALIDRILNPDASVVTFPKNARRPGL
jgi:integrase